jgi:hypothetical protein
VALSAFVRNWFVALAEGRDLDACAMLDEPNTYGRSWSPTDLLAVIADHQEPTGSRFLQRVASACRESGVGFEYRDQREQP